MCGNLTDQVRSIAKATTAVARADLSQKVTIGEHGEVLQLVVTINEMVDRLATFAAFASEVTRVAHQVGTKGNLGVTAKVDDIEGTWQEITNNVNTMGSTSRRRFALSRRFRRPPRKATSARLSRSKPVVR